MAMFCQSCRLRELSLLLTTLLLLTYVTLDRNLQERSRPLERLLVKSNWFQKSTHFSDVLAETKFITNCGTGPDDFASMGDAVHNLTRLLGISPRLLAKPDAFAEVEAALDHLFPFVYHMSNSTSGSLPEYKKGTQGLVIPCGAKHFNYALHLVASVCHVLKCPLAIEIMYTADELVAEQRNALESIGPNIVTMDILTVFDENIVGLQNAGFAIKTFAALASKFEHVILVDADTIFLQSPSMIFAHPTYISTGTMFFHDRMVGGPSETHNWWHSIMQGRTPSPMMEQSAFWANKTQHEMDSGLVAMNKSKRGVHTALAFASWMNIKVVREQTTYIHTYGACIYFAFLIPVVSSQATLHSALLKIDALLQVTRNHSGWPLN